MYYKAIRELKESPKLDVTTTYQYEDQEKLIAEYSTYLKFICNEKGNFSYKRSDVDSFLMVTGDPSDMNGFNVIVLHNDTLYSKLPYDDALLSDVSYEYSFINITNNLGFLYYLSAFNGHTNILKEGDNYIIDYKCVYLENMNSDIIFYHDDDIESNGIKRENSYIRVTMNSEGVITSIDSEVIIHVWSSSYVHRINNVIHGYGDTYQIDYSEAPWND